MKFSARLLDTGSTESFSKMAHTASRLSTHECVIRLLPDELRFVHSDSVRDSGSWFSISVRTREVFGEYRMMGYSDEENEIVLEVNISDMARIMRSAHESVRIKLTSKEGQPHLRFQIRAAFHNAITHDLPVNVIAPSAWSDFVEPEIRNAKIGAVLPHSKKIHRIISSFKTMGVKYVKIRLNRDGRMVLIGEMDMASASVFFPDLTCIRPRGDGAATSNGDDDEPSEVEVRLDIRFISALLTNLQLNFAPLQLRIVNERLAVFTIDQADAKLLYVVGALLCA